MGRTVAPFSQALKGEFKALGQFRRALRKEDQEALDHLFDSGKQHVAASVYAGHPWPMDLVLENMKILMLPIYINLQIMNIWFQLQYIEHY